MLHAPEHGSEVAQANVPVLITGGADRLGEVDSDLTVK